MKQRASQSPKFGAKSHKLGFNHRIDTHMLEDYLYATSLYLGESGQEVKVLLDTGSDWLVVEPK